MDCYDGNVWLVVYGRLPNGSPADGFELFHQTKAGTYTNEGGGSDMSGTGPGLRAKGVPQDLVNYLTYVAPAPPHISRFDYSFTSYLGAWGGHERRMTIRADGTATLQENSGCCNGFTVPLKVKFDRGLLIGTVTGAPTVVGTLKVTIPLGAQFTMRLELQRDSVGPRLALTSPGSDDSSAQTFCGPGDYGCGA